MTDPAVELRIALVRAVDAPPERFAVLARADVVLPRARVELRVIGASSVVTVRAGGVELAEVIACTDAAGDLAAYCAATLRAAGVSSAALAYHNGRAGYSARVWTTPLGQNPFPAPLPHVLEHAFPGPGAPVTRLEAGALRGGVLLRTRHDYPEAGVVVWSESRWELPGSAS